jgi:hypothetical protein
MRESFGQRLIRSMKEGVQMLKTKKVIPVRFTMVEGQVKRGNVNPPPETNKPKISPLPQKEKVKP